MSTRTKVFTAIGALSIVAAATTTAVGVDAADHLDAPGVQADGRTDINDVYVFQSPTNPDNTVLIMTVNPIAGVRSGTTFHPDAEYAFNIDDDGDAEADTVIEVEFDRVRNNGRQRIEIDGDNHIRGRGWVGGNVRLRDGGTATAGVFDDPFFFDLAGFRNNFQFTGTNFFAGLNVTAIVIEVPSHRLGDGGIGVWATTSVDDQQIDHMGRPAIGTALINSDSKDAFNQAEPAEHRALFGDQVRARITTLSGDAAYAAAVADILLPDVLTFELGNGGGFLNGRRLADDVIDVELGVLTNGGLTTDGVNANDLAFPGVFPYLAAAQ